MFFYGGIRYNDIFRGGVDRFITLEVALISKILHTQHRIVECSADPLLAKLVRHTAALSCRGMMQQNAKGLEQFT